MNFLYFICSLLDCQICNWKHFVTVRLFNKCTKIALDHAEIQCQMRLHVNSAALSQEILDLPLYQLQNTSLLPFYGEE